MKDKRLTEEEVEQKVKDDLYRMTQRGTKINQPIVHFLKSFYRLTEEEKENIGKQLKEEG